MYWFGLALWCSNQASGIAHASQMLSTSGQHSSPTAKTLNLHLVLKDRGKDCSKEEVQICSSAIIFSMAKQLLVK